MLSMKTHEAQTQNNDHAESIRTKVLQEIERTLAAQRYSPDELTRLLEALRPEPQR